MSFEAYIKKHREFFENEEINPGHIRRFHNKFNRNRRKKSLYMAIRIAALLVLLVGIPILFFHQDIAASLSSNVLPGDVSEARVYYSKLVDDRMDELSKLHVEDDLGKNIRTELKSIDNSLNNLRDDLKTNPSDERVQDAMIMLYQTKVDFLDYVISKTKNL